MSSFIRESFYIQPPEEDAPAEVWEAWLKADKKAAAAAKRAHTIATKAEPENLKLWHTGSGFPLRGKDGVHRQSDGFIGFQADGEESAEVIAISAATQDRHHQSHGTKGNRAAQRTAAKRKRKLQKRLRLVKG